MKLYNYYTTKKKTVNKLLLLIFILGFTYGCKKKEFIIMIEQPSSYELNNLKVEIDIDDKNQKDINLKYTKITPQHSTILFPITKQGKHLLKIKLKDTLFKYPVSYPEEKYIIIAPYLKKSGQISIGILKQKVKYNYH